jgi:hypothetical protein
MYFPVRQGLFFVSIYMCVRNHFSLFDRGNFVKGLKRISQENLKSGFYTWTFLFRDVSSGFSESCSWDTLRRSERLLGHSTGKRKGAWRTLLLDILDLVAIKTRINF